MNKLIFIFSLVLLLFYVINLTKTTQSLNEFYLNKPESDRRSHQLNLVVLKQKPPPITGNPNIKLWKIFRFKILNSISKRKEWCKDLKTRKECDEKLKGTLCQIIVDPVTANWNSSDHSNLNNFLRYAPKFGAVYKPNIVGIDGQISELYKKMILRSENKNKALPYYIKFMKASQKTKNQCFPWEETNLKLSTWLKDLKTQESENKLPTTKLFHLNLATSKQQEYYCGWLNTQGHNQAVIARHYLSQLPPRKQRRKRMNEVRRLLAKARRETIKQRKFNRKRDYCQKELGNIRQQEKEMTIEKNKWTQILDIHETKGFVRTEKNIKVQSVKSDSESSRKTIYHVKTIIETIVFKGIEFKMSLYSKGVEKIDVKPSQSWMDLKYLKKKVANYDLWYNKLKYGGSKGKFPLLPKSIYLIYKPKIVIDVSKSQYERLKRMSSKKGVSALLISNLRFGTHKVVKVNNDEQYLNDLNDDYEAYQNQKDKIKFTHFDYDEKKAKKNNKMKFKKMKGILSKEIDNDYKVNQFIENNLENLFDSYLDNSIQEKSLSDTISFGERRKKPIHTVVIRKIPNYLYEGNYEITFTSNDDKPQILAVVSDIL